MNLANITNLVMVYGPILVSVLYLGEKAFKLIAAATPSKKDDEIAAKIDSVLGQAIDVLGLQVDAAGNVMKK